MSDHDEEESDGSSFKPGDGTDSESSSLSEGKEPEVEKMKSAGKKSWKSSHSTKNTSKNSIKDTKIPDARNKPEKSTRSKKSKTSEHRNVTEVQVVEHPSKRQRVIERQVRLRMANAATEEQDEFNQEAVKKAVYMQKSRLDAYKISKINLATIRSFVYDKGLVGPSQRELLDELLEEIGVEAEDEVAIREKLKTKVINVNRTRREFYEMATEDAIDDVKQRLVHVFKTFGKRAGALQKVKEAIAELEEFAATL
jgi:hypothetical protein